MKTKLTVIVLLFSFFSSVFIFAGELEEIGSFSLFEMESLQKIKPGDILTAKGALMDFERGISSEMVFLAPYPLEKVVERTMYWDQTAYSDLGILIQGKIPSEGVPDFSKLSFIPSLRPVAKFMDKTRDTRDHESALHLSSSEATMIARYRDSLDANQMNRIWSLILKNRFQAYQNRGLSGLPVYDVTSNKISVGSEVDSILAEQPMVSKRFASVFAKIKSAPNEGQHYWQLEDVDGTAVLVMGTVYINRLSESAVQVVDLQWSVTSGYYTTFTCYEMHDVEIGKTDVTMVWRGDYTSISMRQMRKGVERLFSVNIMIQEIKKSVRCFLEDLGKK